MTNRRRPGGERFEGRAGVRAFWERFFKGASDQRFETEEIFACGDRCTVRWCYTWTGLDGKVAEKLSCVKG